jgi:predicted nucleic acid-binding protein
MNGPLFIDTNVLLYSISRDPAEARKRDIAVAIVDTDNLALSVQVLQEFYVQATRATRPDAVPHEIAVGLIRTWLRFKVQEVTLAYAWRVRAQSDSRAIVLGRGYRCCRPRSWLSRAAIRGYGPWSGNRGPYHY